jgi:transporter family protein
MIINCLAVSCIFGVCPLIEKHVLKYIEIESFLILCAFVFFLLALLYTLLVHQPKLIRDLDNLNKHTHIYGYILLFVILFYVSAGYIYLHMLHQHRMTHVTTIVATFPIITAILAFLFLDEDITAIQMIGALVAVAGIIILEYKK